jgi:hypothetical protein
MPLSQFFNGSGELHFEDVFLSPRIVKEALEKKFRLVTIDESSSHVRYIIIRLFRLYGGPWFFPQERIVITISRDNSRFSLYWRFIWPEYYVWLTSFIILLAVVVFDKGIHAIPVLLVTFLLSGSLVFLDTNWVSRRARKALKSVGQVSHNKSLKIEA